MTRATEIASRSSGPPLTLVTPIETPGDVYRDALRQLAGGVSVVTVGTAPHRKGFTATCVAALSIEPARLLVSVPRASSSLPELERCRCFGVNVLAAHHGHIATRFGSARIKGEASFARECWHPMETGASLLCDALAAFDCELEELIERNGYAVIVGRVVAARRRSAGDTLVYWRGDYHNLRDSGDEGSLSAWEPILESRNIGCG